jgi:hypothetical protein
MRVGQSLVLLIASTCNVLAQPVAPANSTYAVATTTQTSGQPSVMLAPPNGMFAYLCGFSIRSVQTSAPSAAVYATVSGLMGGSLNFLQFFSPIQAGVGIVEPPLGICLKGSAAGVAVTVQSATIASGSGGNVTISAYGFYQ